MPSALPPEAITSPDERPSKPAVVEAPGSAAKNALELV
jgi:hypothetical protein